MFSKALINARLDYYYSIFIGIFQPFILLASLFNENSPSETGYCYIEVFNCNYKLVNIAICNLSVNCHISLAHFDEVFPIREKQPLSQVGFTKVLQRNFAVLPDQLSSCLKLWIATTFTFILKGKLATFLRLQKSSDKTKNRSVFNNNNPTAE